MVVFVCRENRRIEEVSIKLTNLQDNKQDITILQVRLIRGQRADSRSQLGEPLNGHVVNSLGPKT